MLLFLSKNPEMLHQNSKYVEMVVEGNFVRLFLLVFLSPSSLTHHAFSTTSYCWERLMTSSEIPDWIPRFEILRQGEAIRAGEYQAMSQIPAVGWLIRFSCPKLKTTFSSSPTGLSLPQSTNNKQQSSKKVIFTRRNHLEIHMPWSTNVLSKGYQILTFPFFQEEGIRQGQANANNIISPKLLETSLCMLWPKITLGSWVQQFPQ